jgi:hypothetical protein
MYNSIITYPNQIGNGWGFYVDLENPRVPTYKHGFVKEKYRRNYYNCYDKIDEEIEYYEYEYNKKKEENSKRLEDSKKEEEENIVKINSSALIFNISSTTLITLALSYYIFCVL